MPIFDGINLDIEQGWSSITGVNGSGKSTLLKLISKELDSDKGMITGNDLVLYCPQSTEYPPEDLDELMMTYTSEAFKLRDRLGIKDEWLGSWDVLSHGERKRMQLYVALLSESDVLMVDEPTNHLDFTSQKIVREALQAYEGVGILVSHDRSLLDLLTQHTIMIKGGELIKYRTSFTLANQAYDQGVSHQKNVLKTQENELKKVKRDVQMQREKVSLAKQRFSKKNVGRHDSSEREKINGALFTSKDRMDGQILQRTVTKARHISEKMQKATKEYDTGITFEGEIVKHGFPLGLEEGVLNLFDTTNLHFPNLRIDMGDKIGITGDNGSGKSTFIEHLIQKLSFEHSLLYIPQEISDEEAEKLFKEVSALGDEEKGELFTLIQRLGSDAKALLGSKLPSPGEIRKLLLGLGLLQQPSLIILDEPTNHMDLVSIEALEESLSEYAGALIFITHDQTFLDNLSSKKWLFGKSDDETFVLTEQL